MAKTSVKNFGCRINAYESSILEEMIKPLDNTVIVNTCSVTGEAHRQCLQTVRKLKKDGAGKIIVTGCAATVAPQDFAKTADVIVPNSEKLIPSKYGVRCDKKEIFMGSMNGKVRAFIGVQFGCNHKCTYCIIPKARGKSISTPYERIKKQISMLLDRGTKEITIAGINLTDYEGGLSQLVRKIFRDFPDIRLRLGSLDPYDMNISLISEFEDERLMPYVHLSIQSGDDYVLKRMARRHKSWHVKDIIKTLKSVRPSMVIGADFITGFSTETEEQFENTCRLVQDLGISMLHVFPFSVRQGTPAARMAVVDINTRKERAAKLRNLGQRMLNGTLNSFKGKTVNALIENNEKGHTDEFLPIHVEGTAPGEIVKAVIEDIKDMELQGRRI